MMLGYMIDISVYDIYVYNVREQKCELCQITSNDQVYVKNISKQIIIC